MKFGEYLTVQKTTVWPDKCLDYDRLKTLIREMESAHINVVTNSRTTSLSGELNMESSLKGFTSSSSHSYQCSGHADGRRCE